MSYPARQQTPVAPPEAHRPHHASRSGEGLSLQTLIIAAIASGIAAIVTSAVWRGGTIVTASLTPVIVAIVKELLAKPMQSDLVRRPISTIGRVPAARPNRRFAREGSERQRPGEDPLATRGTAPIRTYGRPRRRLHLKLAVITGLIAFVIAAVALTVPELIFGGSIASNHSTTIFGGGSSKSQQKSSNGSSKSESQSSQSSQGSDRSSGSTAPSQTTSPRTTPQQTTTQQSPPTSGSSPSPPSTGSPAPRPSAPSTQAPSTGSGK